MGQPTIPAHRLLIGWICLSIGCIVILYFMFRLWYDFRITIKTAPMEETATRNKIESDSPSSIKSTSKTSARTGNIKSSSKTKIRIRILIWCTLICYFIFISYVLISRFYVFIIEDDKVNISCFLWVFPQITSFMTGRIFLYLLWFYRFYYVFKESMFQKSKIFSYTMSSGIIISMLVSMIFYLVIYTLYADNHCQLSGDKGHLLIAALPFTFFDLMWSVIILYLFVGHLFKLLNISIGLSNSDRQVHILNLIKKLNILVNISILSTWLIFVSIYSYSPLSSSAIDCCINSISILLSLQRYDMLYNKFCFICINHYESCFMRYCCCCCKWCHKADEQSNNDINMLAIDVNN